MAVQSVLSVASAEPVVEAKDVAVADMDSLIAPGGELHGVVGKIEKALIKIIGPIGEIMLEDALIAWADEEAPSLRKINHLMDLLEIEVDDREQYYNFQELLGSV